MSVFTGSITAGAVIMNDYVIKVEDIDGGHRLIITRGTEVQDMEIYDDYMITIEEHEGGRRLRAVRGSSVQTLDVPLDYEVRLDDIEGGCRVTIAHGDDVQTFDVFHSVRTINGVAPDENGEFHLEFPEGFSGKWEDLANKPAGANGQVLGYDADGNMVAQDLMDVTEEGPKIKPELLPGSGGGAGAYWVQLMYRIEGEETVFTSDKTLDEMLEAYAAGQLVCVNCDMDGMGLPLYPVLMLVSERVLSFASPLVIGSGNFQTMTITPDGWMPGLPD